MSKTDESNDKPILREELAELERRINERIDDKASAHDRTTQAHVDGLSKNVDARFDVVNEKFKGVHQRIDKLEETVQKQADNFQLQVDQVLDAIEKMDSKFTSQVRDLEKKISAGLAENDNREKYRITLLGLLLVLYVTVIIAVAGWMAYALSVAT